MFTSPTGPLTRREWLKLSALGALSVPASGWLDVLAARAAEQSPGKRKHKSCILLFMEGGPSHIDTFDPKPDNKSSELKSIATSVPGIRVCEHLPKVAQLMKDVALLRGMSTSEGSHGRARYYMHTGYREGVGGVLHPSLGAIASSFLGKPDDQLPNFFALTGGSTYGSGYAGPMHAPVQVTNPAQGLQNLKPRGTMNAFDTRLGLLDELEKGFVDRMQAAGPEAHQATYKRAAELMHSEKVKVFDLSQEPASVRSAYGSGKFGEACLLARRLVEQGVAFVEVGLGNWDTHTDNGRRVKDLCGELDPAMAALLTDLKQRGMLETTLVICMGEFGRGPTMGRQGGRDHHPRAWTSVLAGGGLKLGQAIGRTDKQGGTVEDTPVSAVDFMATVCKALGIDYTKNFRANGRPMRVVDKNEKLVKALL